MAIIRRQPEPERGITRARTWDPLDMMQELMRWDPFREMSRRLGRDDLTGFVPTFDVKETKEAYIFKADLPGVKEGDVELSMTSNRLTISGQRQEEKKDEGDQYYAYERSYGSFSRSFTLPEGVDVDQIRAELKDGVLTSLSRSAPKYSRRRFRSRAAKKAAKKPRRSEDAAKPTCE